MLKLESKHVKQGYLHDLTVSSHRCLLITKENNNYNGRIRQNPMIKRSLSATRASCGDARNTQSHFCIFLMKMHHLGLTRREPWQIQTEGDKVTGHDS